MAEGSITRGWFVNIGVICGALLVLLLIGYLVYALLNAEEF
jgi:K+-transporting ATPase KdpF subunit